MDVKKSRMVGSGDDGIGGANWGVGNKWAGVFGVADYARSACGVLHVCGAVSRTSTANAASDLPGDGCGCSGVAYSFADYVFHRTDSGVAKRVRVAEVRRDRSGGDGCGDFDDARVGTADHGDRGNRA